MGKHQATVPHRKSQVDRASDLSDGDQTSADADQTGADLDQTLSETDQTSSERDQVAADRDQESADRDQRASDQQGDADGHPEVRARSQRDRARSAGDRDRSAQARSKTAALRGENAARRDVVAAERDDAAQARDELAVDIDAELGLLDGPPPGVGGGAVDALDRWGRAQAARRGALLSRARAATLREAAARDRREAAEDRAHAANDRREAEIELAMEGIDHLTGALRRRAGMVALQRELDRNARSGDPLVIAFITLDGLTAINDSDGHAAGDDFVRQVAEAIEQSMRSDDVMVRYGGDELVCSLAGLDAAGARQRFAQLAGSVAEPCAGQKITVGVAHARLDESLADVIVRARDAMMEARRRAV